MEPLLRLRNRVTLICLAAVSACGEPPATDQSGAVSGEASGSDEIRGEQLLAISPRGWQQGFATKTPALRLAEFLPADANVEDWRDKVTFESLSGNPLPDPIDFLMGLSDDQASKCERLETFNIQSGLENNYPTSVRLLTCSENKVTKRGHVTLIKAIQGNDHFYVITRAKRMPPMGENEQPISEAEMAAWSTYMRTITVCDSEREQHPCPTATMESSEEDSATESPPT